MKITDYVEDHIFTGSIFSKIFASQQAQTDKLNNQLKDLEDQAYIHLATWGLKYWAEALGLEIYELDTYESIRQRCLASFRGKGNCTIDYLKNTCLSFGYIDSVYIDEIFEEYYFNLLLNSEEGFPKNVYYLYDIIRKITPGHLGIYYKLKSNKKIKNQLYNCNINNNIKVYNLSSALETEYKSDSKVNIGTSNIVNVELNLSDSIKKVNTIKTNSNEATNSILNVSYNLK